MSAFPPLSVCDCHTPVPADVVSLERILARRHSCRSFQPQPVPQETIEAILAIAQRTASWCNSQPWRVIVTSGEATHRFREALRAHANAHPRKPDFAHPVYEGVSKARRRECGLALYDSVGIAHGDREASARQALKNYELFGAPHTALITTDALLGVYGAVDCGAYVANFMNAATALGIATIAQAALANYPDFVRSHFGLPADRLVLCGISFGYCDSEHPVNRFRTTRAPLSDVVSWAN